MTERNAIQTLMMNKLTDALKTNGDVAKAEESTGDVAKAEEPTMPVENAPIEKKERPLQKFLSKRKSKKEFSIELAKGEEISCPDCRKNIFDGKGFSGCICLGQDMDKKIFMKKSEDGVRVRFSRGWDPENIEMLLDILQKKNR
jgi:hypothetical protein